MNTKLVRIFLCIFLAFSIMTLACNTLTNSVDPVSGTMTAVANLVATSQVEISPLELTVNAQVAQAGSQDIVLTANAYSTQIAENGVYNVTPPAFILSEIPPDWGSGNIPADIPVMPNASDLKVMPNVIMYGTPSTKEEGNEFYTAEMAKLGWTIDSNRTTSNQYAFNLFFYKTELHTAMVTINIATGVTRVTVMYTGTP